MFIQFAAKGIKVKEDFNVKVEIEAVSRKVWHAIKK